MLRRESCVVSLEGIASVQMDQRCLGPAVQTSCLMLGRAKEFPLTTVIRVDATGILVCNLYCDSLSFPLLHKQKCLRKDSRMLVHSFYENLSSRHLVVEVSNVSNKSI